MSAKNPYDPPALPSLPSGPPPDEHTEVSLRQRLAKGVLPMDDETNFGDLERMIASGAGDLDDHMNIDPRALAARLANTAPPARAPVEIEDPQPLPRRPQLAEDEPTTLGAELGRVDPKELARQLAEQAKARLGKPSEDPAVLAKRLAAEAKARLEREAAEVPEPTAAPPPPKEDPLALARRLAAEAKARLTPLPAQPREEIVPEPAPPVPEEPVPAPEPPPVSKRQPAPAPKKRKKSLADRAPRRKTKRSALDALQALTSADTEVGAEPEESIPEPVAPEPPATPEPPIEPEPPAAPEPEPVVEPAPEALPEPQSLMEPTGEDPPRVLEEPPAPVPAPNPPVREPEPVVHADVAPSAEPLSEPTSPTVDHDPLAALKELLPSAIIESQRPVHRPSVFIALWEAHQARALKDGNLELAGTATLLLNHARNLPSGRLIGVRFTLDGTPWAAFLHRNSGQLLGIVPRPEIFLAGLQ